MSDYIKREDAIEAIGNFLSREDDYFIDLAKGTIRMLKSADVEPVRHGRWIEDTESKDEIYVHPVTCSVCGSESLLEYGTLTKYCPNCGAKMYVERETA